MDERVLAPGQYRDANNVQVMTSDGSNTGSLQTLLGNTNVTEDTVYTFVDPTISKVVGVQALPEEDKVYFMVYSGSDVATVPVGTPQKDYIVEYNTQKKTTDFVFVDIHTAKHAVTTACDDGTKVFKIKGGDQSWAHGIRIGMSLTGTFNDGSGSTTTISSTWDVKVTKIRYYASYWWIHHDSNNAVGSSVGDVLTVSAPRVLKFNPHNVIHSIDIINNMMFWTDNQNEPRKIHLERSKRGTGGIAGPLIGRNKLFYHNTMPAGVMTNSTFNDTLNTGLFHTRLVKRAESTSTQLVLALNRSKDQPVWVKEDHITVIKKSPTNALSLKMFSSKAERSNDSGIENPVSGTTTAFNLYDTQNPPQLLEVGDTFNVAFQGDIDLRIGDILMLSSDQNAGPDSFADDEAEARATVSSLPPGTVGPNNISNAGQNFGMVLNSVDTTLSNEDVNWVARVEQEKPMFEFKFPRFSYRWRYQDGEYSTFAPWSEVAFLPGDFDYLPKKGFNLGMANRLRYLKLVNYFPEWGAFPEDVVEIDLLYKETNKSTVYTVKTLKPQDAGEVWPDLSAFPYKRGEFDIKSELIHAVVPSNQLLRPWDNVPRVAKTQVMTANRLVFGNYKQNYNIDESLVMNNSHKAFPIPASQIEDEEIPNRSVKSIRTYQIGVVWSDKYGRETPVMVPKEGGSVTIDKKDCINQNYLSAKIQEQVLRPSWAEFVSYYVKETSNEYYNLAMDRFYDAEDGNVWLSFPSAERNKIEADTYLYLKKAHDSNLPVIEKARYRVVAVENDAPLFIRKFAKSYGFETLEFKNGGLPEEGRKYIIVSKAHFDNHFESVLSPVRLDNLQIRLGGVSGADILVSELYDVINVSKSGGATWYKITLEQALGSECTGISILDRTTEMKLEVVQNKFIDKPEFDGRFFVKILKDLTLERELLSTITAKPTYQVLDTMTIGFASDHNGMSESDWDTFKWAHKGDQYSTTSNWMIDDMDTNTGSGKYSNNAGATNHYKMNNQHINHGGMWNWPQGNEPIFGNGTGGAGGNGYMDISYMCFSSSPSGDGAKFATPWSYLKNPGTLFRFKDDPAQVVFRIEGYKGRLSSTSKAGDTSGIVKTGSERSDFQFYQRNCHSSGLAEHGDYGWYNERGSQPFVWNYHKENSASNKEQRWNFDGRGYNNGPQNWGHNQRWGIRIKVDKMWGSGPNHLMDSASMAPMTKKDTNGDDVVVLDGENYSGSSYAGSVTTSKNVTAGVNGSGNSGGTTNQWEIGDYHDWYPITSDTGVYLNTANQLAPATDYSVGNWSNTKNHSPLPHSKYATGRSVYVGANHSGQEKRQSSCTLEFLEPSISIDQDGGASFSSTNPAVWETEPKEDVGLDIYYEACAKIPLNPDHTQNELLIPIGSKVWNSNGTTYLGEVAYVNSVSRKKYLTKVTLVSNLTIAKAHDSWVRVERPDKTMLVLFVNNSGGAAANQKDMVFITGENAIDQTTGAIFSSERAPWHNPMLLAWSNCWAFGNGIESDRVRDDFNAPQLDNGVKASTTLATPYEEELRSSGMIFSGIFNSTSGVNDLNQFIQAEPITKDINPSYGTIQRMYARNTNTLVFCEDKVLNILTNKDALYNADGNSNVTSSNNVLGAPTPIPGDYGISTNPESLAVAPGAMYWCDPMRGKVLKLEGNSTIKILSDVGMKDYFNDVLINVADVIGTYDEKKADYNISIGKKVTPSQVFSTKTTITYSEVVKGWTAFKSFEPEMGVSINNEYYTFKNGQMWQHHVSESIDYTPTAVPPNNFYGVQYYPDVTLFLNDNPGSVKSFNTLNYEGTQSRITSHLTDLDYYNLGTKKGWYVDSLTTDLQEVGQLEFKSKEGKWFSAIKGVATTLDNLDEREFSVQGLGGATTSTTGTPVTQSKLTVSPGVQSSTGTNWDTSADSVDWNFTGTLTQTISSGTVYPTSYKDAILHNITFNQGGALVYSGLDLDAANFTATGGAATTSGTGNATVYTYTAGSGWNADAGITHVEFTNIGIAGDPGNTVRARIHYSSFTAPSTAKNMFVDIDHGGATSSGGNIYRNACVKVHYNQTINANSRTVTVVQTDIADITETNIDQFDPNGHAEKSNEHEATGGVLQGQTTKMAEYTITAGNSEYLISQSNSKGVKTQYHTHSSAAPWQQYFSYNITDTMHTSTGNTNKVKKTVVEIFYTPPVGVTGLDPDPVSGEGGWCSFMHCVELTWLARELQAPAGTTPTLQMMTWSQPNPTGTSNSLGLISNNMGRVGITIQEGSNYYTLTGGGFNEWAGSWSEGGEPVINDVYIDRTLSVSLPVSITASSAASSITAYATALTSGEIANLVLGASVGTINSRTTCVQQTPITNSIIVAAKTNTTRLPTTISGFTALANAYDMNLTRTVSITYTATGENTIAINRQPSDSDISGGSQTATLTVGSAGGTNLTISDADAVGLTPGMSVKHPGSVINAESVDSIASATILGFNAADYASILVGMTITGNFVPANTTVTAKAVVSGKYQVTISNAETTSQPALTTYIFSGMIAPGVTISSLSSDGTDTTLVISAALAGAIAQFDLINLGTGNSINSNLSVVMLETVGANSASEITTVQNKKALVSGTISMDTMAATATNITITPNFLTVS
jgi:hypothetical protein